MAYSKFSKNCLNVLMAQRFQFHLYQLNLHHNQLDHHHIISVFCNVFLVFKRFSIRRKENAWFISVTIPQTTYYLSVIFALFKKTEHWHHNI